jgi:hypothetical protein
MDPMNPSTDQPPAGIPAPGAIPPGTGAPPPVWSMPPSPIQMPPVVPATPLAPARRRRDPLTILMVVAAFVALGGVGFAAGRVTAPAAAATTAGRGGFGNGSFNNPGTGSFTTGGNGAAGLGRGGFGGGVSLNGTITEATSDHITLKLANGSTLTIPVDSSTTYHRQASAASGDVTTGATVQVQLNAGGTPGVGIGQQPAASGAPGGATRALGPASDITIVGQ